MQIVFGGVLIMGGALLIGLSFHNQIVAAWTDLIS